MEVLDKGFGKCWLFWDFFDWLFHFHAVYWIGVAIWGGGGNKDKVVALDEDCIVGVGVEVEV